MAIRLEVHKRLVHLIEITVSDRAEIPHLVASSPSAGIQYQRMAMAEALFEKLAAAGIWLDADTKNRFLYDISSAVDAAYVKTIKAFNDTTLTSDAIDLLVEKHFNNIIGFVETRAFEVAKPLSDAANALDLKQLALMRPVQDTYNVSETSELLVEKDHADTVGTSDTFTNQVSFFRQFADAVAIDDLMNIDKLWDSTKGNVAFIGDLSDFLLTRPVSDTTTVIDAYALSTSQIKADSVPATDASTFDFTRFSAETVATSDGYNLDVVQAKAENLAPSDAYNLDLLYSKTDTTAPTDTSAYEFTLVRPEGLAATDTYSLGVAQSKAETLAPFDAYNLNLSQLKTEAINASDAATVIHYLGAAQLFNRPLFNQTTFG